MPSKVQVGIHPCKIAPIINSLKPRISFAVIKKESADNTCVDTCIAMENRLDLLADFSPVLKAV